MVASPVTITFVAASPYQLKYKLTSSIAGTGGITATGGATPDLLTNCALKAGSAMYDLFAKQVATQDDARAVAFEHPELNIFLIPRDADAEWAFDANAVGGHLQLLVTCAAADVLGSYLVVDYRHSMIR